MINFGEVGSEFITAKHSTLAVTVYTRYPAENFCNRQNKVWQISIESIQPCASVCVSSVQKTYKIYVSETSIVRTSKKKTLKISKFTKFILDFDNALFRPRKSIKTKFQALLYCSSIFFFLVTTIVMNSQKISENVVAIG